MKEPEGCRVEAPQQLNYSFVTVQFQLMVVHICGKELLDDQHAGGAGSQPVSLGGWVAQIRKDLGVAEKV